MTAALVARHGPQGGRPRTIQPSRAAGPSPRSSEGIHFNLGPHALYCRGPAFRLLQELGVPFTGGFPDARRGVLTRRGVDRTRSRAGSARCSRRGCSRRGRRCGFLRLFADDAADRMPDGSTASRSTTGSGRPPESATWPGLIRTLCRVSTYMDDAARLSAGAAIDQLKLVIAGGVWYLDGGWQVARRRPSGPSEGTGRRRSGPGAGSRSVRGDARRGQGELASGEALRGRTAVLAIDPDGAVRPAERPPIDASAREVDGEAYPVRAACLDVALSRLPRPRAIVAFGLDRPLYYSVHSAFARAGAGGCGGPPCHEVSRRRTPTSPEARRRQNWRRSSIGSSRAGATTWSRVSSCRG